MQSAPASAGYSFAANAARQNPPLPAPWPPYCRTSPCWPAAATTVTRSGRMSGAMTAMPAMTITRWRPRFARRRSSTCPSAPLKIASSARSTSRRPSSRVRSTSSRASWLRPTAACSMWTKSTCSMTTLLTCCSTRRRWASTSSSARASASPTRRSSSSSAR